MKNTSDKMTVQVIVNGRPVKTYQHEDRTYIEGKKGTQYSIRVHNNSSKRICANVSVDGLSVVTGKRATGNEQAYIVAAWSYIDIDGFRSSQDTVGAFKFSSKQGSYAATKGKQAAQNVGVIGVIGYEEKQTMPTVVYRDRYNPPPLIPPHNPYRWDPYRPEAPWTYTTSNCRNISTYSAEVPPFDVATASCCSFMQTPEQPRSVAKCASFDLGTTWGDKIDSKVEYVEFERGARLPMVQIYYASRDSLKAMGIEFNPKPAIEAMPLAFDMQFATPPSGWP